MYFHVFVPLDGLFLPPQNAIPVLFSQANAFVSFLLHVNLTMKECIPADYKSI